MPITEFKDTQVLVVYSRAEYAAKEAKSKELCEKIDAILGPETPEEKHDHAAEVALDLLKSVSEQIKLEGATPVLKAVQNVALTTAEFIATLTDADFEDPSEEKAAAEQGFVRT